MKKEITCDFFENYKCCSSCHADDEDSVYPLMGWAEHGWIIEACCGFPHKTVTRQQLAKAIWSYRRFCRDPKAWYNEPDGKEKTGAAAPKKID